MSNTNPTRGFTLSVIVPLYNASEFVNHCLQSIINQSFKDFEIIVIDDLSTDDSLEVVQNILHGFEHFKIVETKGGNLAGGCRNIGLKHAKGKYIGFVDCDDWIDSMMFERMVKTIERLKSEIAICGIMTEYDNSRLAKIRYHYEMENVISGDFALNLLSRNLNQDITISPIVNNKIYRSDFLSKNKITFIPNSINEDDAFTFLCFLNAKTIAITPNTYYHYWQRNGSVTKTFGKRHFTDLIDAFIHIKIYMKGKGVFQSYKTDYYAFFEKCLEFVLNNLINSEKDKSVQTKYLKLLFSLLSQVEEPGLIIEYLGANRIHEFVSPYKIK